MNGDRAFFDTNVFVYALQRDDGRSEQAEELLSSAGTISVQVLNEFVAVAIRKLRMNWSEVREGLDAIQELFPEPLPLTRRMRDSAVTVAERYGFHIYDAMIVAAALQGSCTVLYTEDLRDGQVIDGLTIRNPFR